MPSASLYHPAWFYSITIFIALALGILTAYTPQKGQMALLLLGLCVPCITALAMIYSSHGHTLVQDLWHRLLLFKISPVYLLVILFLMPCVIYLATSLSLVFGFSTDQFLLSKQLSVMKGSALLGILIPLILAPIVEELGWRGYGVDSLRVHFNLFNTSVLFGVLWALWHLPAFFIKGYYHNDLWHLGFIYVLNFFVSVFLIAFLINWIYYRTGRSIPAVILFHAVLNLSSMALRTEPLTKCLATVLLLVVVAIVVVWDQVFFFSNST